MIFPMMKKSTGVNTEEANTSGLAGAHGGSADSVVERAAEAAILADFESTCYIHLLFGLVMTQSRCISLVCSNLSLAKISNRVKLGLVSGKRNRNREVGRNRKATRNKSPVTLRHSLQCWKSGYTGF